MKAALLLGPAKVAVSEVPDPVPGPGDVRIAVCGVGLCGSDLAVYRGKWSPPSYPWIQGHEAFGRIDAVGDGVPSSRLGETVVVEPNIPCLSCSPCARGRTSACTNRQSLGMNRQGALAERLVVPSSNAWTAEGIADRDLVCVEPLVVVEAALRRLGEPAPAVALVLGVGSQGLLMTLSLVGRGARVVVHDMSPERLAVAASLGARPLDPAGPPIDADLVVDTVGAPDTMTLAVHHAAIASTILVLGLEATPFELSAQTLVRKQLSIRGSLTYDHPDDFRATIARLQDHAIAPGRVLTDAFALDDVALAFEAGPTAAGKAWIRVADRC